MDTLQGKTLFITGASRGIGKAIALRAARDGANVIIAAKTTEPDPRLPGTIYSAAEEIRAAGGKALPLVVDVREEEQVAAAIEQGVAEFGGIDILVNNASAISLTNTQSTSMKRYDLMMDINVRGTFVCAKHCIPHLLQASNPHILTLSPPIDLNPKWFARHAAYTTSKYAMSMIVHGLAAQLAEDGVGVNALWPRTAIATAALNVAMPGGAKYGRTPDIMADAAHQILTRKSRTTNGNFFIDEAVLRDSGITDFSHYQVTPGEELMIDLFVEPGHA
ncbi:SDR family oxidoreductase [Pseudoduganella violaceinigra]|uniref:SDR family oxidoreductase n=1 Tax=Pseudoduganella violaceinigra TaxID=246602 RepID=UPI0003FB2019|nr:NAD(P)-dependent oxidoreductase [Pseudoduganella violaceinigra]